jgi:uncharacterized protein (DUF302 family)
MGVMDVMMNGLIKILSKEQREKMMVNMMPLMMEGLDINDLMPKMATAMLQNVTVDDVIEYLKRTLAEKEKVGEFFEKMKEANVMQNMMFKVYKSTLNFDETVVALEKAAPEHEWTIPDIRDLQQEYHKAGLADMTKVKILYFCMAQGGYKILQDDHTKAMSAMMPIGVSVYETSKGAVEIAAMNLEMMGGMFAGVTQEVLSNGAKNLEKTLEGIVE